VFAIGDVRAGSTKRLAAAVGEGAAVVAQIHTALALRSGRIGSGEGVILTPVNVCTTGTAEAGPGFPRQHPSQFVWFGSHCWWSGLIRRAPPRLGDPAVQHRHPQRLPNGDRRRDSGGTATWRRSPLADLGAEARA
jgi:hypothetical protein